ncbi:MAG: SDR family oxidoreductase [Desulfobacteraceae bacterium]|nr:MAG: SDR family oxidoreductase [Desulfobacteraceae bacterium]
MAFRFGKALVTGGAGFIGSHLVEALVREDCAVTVLDNLSSGHMANLDAVREKIAFVQGDIKDEKTLNRAARGCEVIFHQAAVVSVTQTVQDPVASALVNDIGTIKVLDAARRNDVRRVVLASSSAVYGDAPQLPKTESMIPAPLSPYAVQKLTNEYYADLYYRLYGVETACLRYFNVYGPRQDPSSPYSGVISIFMSKVLSNTPPVIYGGGRQTRDFVFVTDVVQANLLTAASSNAIGRVFNVGTSRSVEINSLWQMIAALAQRRLEAQYGPPRAGDVLHSLASIQRAKESLGFQPAVSFEEGLRQTFLWYSQVQNNTLPEK